MDPQVASLVALRGTLADIIFGSVFVFVGITACLLAIFRHRGEFRLLVWFGLFVGFYGSRMLAQAAGLLQLAPHSPWPDRIEVAVNYLLVIPALLFWVELSSVALRRVFWGLTLLAGIIAAFGLTSYLTLGDPHAFLRYTSLLAILLMILVAVLIVIPPVARNQLILQSRVIRILMPAIACITVFVNVRWYFGIPPPHFVEPVTFAGWIAALGYEAAKHTFDKERRLVSLESELETARQIQSSILPQRVPTITGLCIAASYQPMSAVAGDFYHFVAVDEHRIGLLVADVAGHGVPAALIASMIKVAMQSVQAFACDPSRVLSTLNRILTPELRGRLTSAAYLWLDSECRLARYAAAGHPPLIYWNAAHNLLQRIEDNGLLFGIHEQSDYPCCELSFYPGDRWLLYTDGLTEPENAHQEPFGERQLEHFVRANATLAAPEFSRRILSAVNKWQAHPRAQADDITLVVADVL